MNIEHTDCMVKHQEVILTKKVDGYKYEKSLEGYITREMLRSLLINPSCDIHNLNDYEWINFQKKLDAFIKCFTDCDMTLYDNIGPISVNRCISSDHPFVDHFLVLSFSQLQTDSVYHFNYNLNRTNCLYHAFATTNLATTHQPL